MGSRGPVPDPQKQTGRLGRPVRRRRKTVVPFTAGSITPPVTLRAIGREFWTRYVAAPWITDADHGALERLCSILDELDEFTAAVDKDGPLVPGSKMQPVAHPLLAVIDRWRAAADRLEVELGLTPMARQRMHIGLERPPAPIKALSDEGPYVGLRLADPRSAKDRFGANGHTQVGDAS